jgi:hypothetical protein
MFQKGNWGHRSVTNHKLIQDRFRLRLAGWCLKAAGLLALARAGHGQEALRISMAGDLAAETQQQADNSVGYYNLMLGPTAWRFGSSLGFEYDDNVELQENGQGDLIIRPGINTQMHWPITLKNSLDLSIGAGYSDYLQHSDLSQFFLTPGSGLSFDVYAGDFKINWHDRASITEQSYENAGASGANQNLVSLQNTAGTSALWDLNKAVANFGYDHANYVSLSQNQGEPNASSENIFVNGGIRVRPELLLGVEAGGSVITYSENTPANTPGNKAGTPDAVQWNTGVFGSEQISDYISARLDAGYTEYTPDNAEAGLVTSDTSGLYFSLSLTHRVNRFFSYTLSAGRTTDLGVYGQAQTYYYVRLDSNWKIFKDYIISTPLWWQQGSWIYNSAAGISDYQQIGLGFSVTRMVTQKLSATIGYRFVRETSDLATLTYTVNEVDLNLSYQF